jgi:penicillin-binding protein 1C
VRNALGNSLNVPAVRTLALVGLDRFHDTLRRLGFDTLTEADAHYGAALALGGADVTLLALTNAYRTLANRGLHGPPRVQRGEAPDVDRRVLGAAASFIIADILADRGARALSFGLENPLATRVASAVKTGTSKDMRDNWCVGFTSRYTVGVWVGNFSGAPMRDVSGVTGAAPIWRDVIHFLHAAEVPVETAPPPGLIHASVRFDPPIEAERDEWFLRGTEMAVVRGTDGGIAVTSRIRYPSPDTIIALDPDVPAGHQRVMFEATPAVPGLQWRLDDAVLPDVHGRAAWTPRPGAHTLALEDANGRALSRVTFEVRGDTAAVAAAPTAAPAR